MTRKITIAYLYICVFSIALTIFQSCLALFKNEGKICDIEFRGANNTFTNSTIDTLTSEIEFVVYNVENTTCMNVQQINLINTCNAMTICVEWQNEILTSSFVMSFNRAVILNGDTIGVNSNLFNYDFFKENIQITQEDNCKDVRYYLKFNDSLRNNIVFEKGTYLVNLECNTNDGKIFNKNREVIFNL